MRLETADGEPRDRIVGFETEYGLNYQPATLSEEKTRELSTRERSLRQLSVNERRNRLASGAFNYKDISHANSNQFLETGSREYLDVGQHPEYATAEDVVFLDAAYRLLHGHIVTARRLTAAHERLLDQDLLEEEKGLPNGNVVLVANTWAPSSKLDEFSREPSRDIGTSWSSHENYLVSRELPFENYLYPLAIHNLSRIVWSGSGAVVRDGTTGYRLMLSEKAAFIEKLKSDGTGKNRALVNTRDQPLADARHWRRIHNITGESVFSPFVNALRLASASIVLRACELGVDFDDLIPAEPVRAMHDISSDPSLKRTIRLVNRRRMTGLNLQEALAERSLNAASKAGYLTDQEQAWGANWLQLLDDLGRDPTSCRRTLDWVTKREVVERALDKPHRRSSNFDLAMAQAIGYHTLRPREGAGMQLLRKGYFELSPDNATLEQGLPLPNTRARRRSAVIAFCRNRGMAFDCDWNFFRAYPSPGSPADIYLDDPYQTENSPMEALLARRGASVEEAT